MIYNQNKGSLSLYQGGSRDRKVKHPFLRRGPQAQDQRDKSVRIKDFSIRTPFDNLCYLVLPQLLLNTWKQWQVAPVASQKYNFSLPDEFVKNEGKEMEDGEEKSDEEGRPEAEERMDGSRDSTKDDDDLLSFDPSSLQPIMFSFEYASFQSLDEFHQGAGAHTKNPMGTYAPIQSKHGFTNIYAEPEKKLREYQVVEDGVSEDIDEAGSGAEETQHVSSQHDRQPPVNNELAQDDDPCPFDTIADLSLTNKHPVHQRFGSIPKFLYLSTTLPEKHHQTNYSFLASKYKGQLMSALGIALRTFRVQGQELEGMKEDFDQRFSVASFLKDLHVFIDIKNSQDNRSKMCGMLANHLLDSTIKLQQPNQSLGTHPLTRHLSKTKLNIANIDLYMRRGLTKLEKEIRHMEQLQTQLQKQMRMREVLSRYSEEHSQEDRRREELREERRKNQEIQRQKKIDLEKGRRYVLCEEWQGQIDKLEVEKISLQEVRFEVKLKIRGVKNDIKNQRLQQKVREKQPSGTQQDKNQNDSINNESSLSASWSLIEKRKREKELLTSPQNPQQNSLQISPASKDSPEVPSDSLVNKGMELYRQLRDQEKEFTEKISQMDQEMLRLYNQIEELQEQEVVVSEDEQDEISESGVASPISPELQVELEFQNQFSFWPPVLYATHFYSIQPNAATDSSFITFTKTILPFDIDHKFDPIQQINVQVLQEVMGANARDLLKSQDNMSITNALGSSFQVKISFQKSIEYMGNKKVQEQRYGSRPILCKVFSWIGGRVDPIIPRIEPEIGLMRSAPDTSAVESQLPVKRVNNIFNIQNQLQASETLVEQTTHEIISFNQKFSQLLSKISLLYLLDYEEPSDPTQPPTPSRPNHQSINQSTLLCHYGTPYLSPIWRRLCLYLNYNQLTHSKHFSSPGFGCCTEEELDQAGRQQEQAEEAFPQFRDVEVVSLDEEEVVTPGASALRKEGGDEKEMERCGVDSVLTASLVEEYGLDDLAKSDKGKGGKDKPNNQKIKKDLSSGPYQILDFLTLQLRRAWQQTIEEAYLMQKNQDKEPDEQCGLFAGFDLEKGLDQVDLSIQSLCDIASKHSKQVEHQTQLDQNMLQIILAMKCYKQAQLPAKQAPSDEKFDMLSVNFKPIIKLIERENNGDQYENSSSDTFHPNKFKEEQPIEEKVEFRTPFDCLSLLTQRHLFELQKKLRRPRAIYPDKEYNEVVLPKYIHKLIFLFKRHENSCQAFLNWFHAQLTPQNKHFTSVYLPLVKGVDRDQGQYLKKLWVLQTEMENDAQASLTRQKNQMLQHVYNKELLHQHSEKECVKHSQIKKTLIDEHLLENQQNSKKKCQFLLQNSSDDDNSHSSSDSDSSSDLDDSRYEQCKTSSKVSDGQKPSQAAQAIKKKIDPDFQGQELSAVYKKSEIQKLKEELEFSLEEIMEQHLTAIIDCDVRVGNPDITLQVMNSLLLKLFKLKMFLKVEKSIEIMTELIESLKKREYFQSVEGLAENYLQYCHEHEVLLQDFLVSLYKQHLSAQMTISTQLLIRASLLMKNPFIQKDGMFQDIIDGFKNPEQNEVNLMVDGQINGQMKDVVGFFSDENRMISAARGTNVPKSRQISTPDISQFFFLFEKEKDRRFINFRYDHGVKKVEKSVFW